MSLFRIYKYSVVGLLLVTAQAKLVSTGSHAKILEQSDTLFLLPFRDLMWLGSSMELCVVLVCLSVKQTWLQAAAIAWLSTNFLLYRLGLWWTGYQKPCSCMGSLTDGLNISPDTADTIMKYVLAYLLIGSYTSLVWLWRRQSSAEGLMLTDEAKSEPKFGR
jgi:hypothetical protein